MLRIRRRIKLILLRNPLPLYILLNLGDQRLQKRLIGAHESNRIPLLTPARITTNLDTLRLNLGRQLSQIRRNGTFRQRRTNHEAGGTLTLGIRQPGRDGGLEVLQESFEETWHAGQDVHVAVDYGDWNPHVLGDEQGLLFGGDGRVVGELDHAQFGG